MKFFEVQPDDEGFRHNYYIDAAHKYDLPGAKCPSCGFIGGALGVCYPDLSVPVGVDPSPYESGWPVAPIRVRELAKPLERIMPEKLPFPPGTEFGQLSGKASGRFGDFTWVNPWTPLVAPNALEALFRKGITNLKTVATDIKLRSKTRRFKYLELCLYPVARAFDPEPSPNCAECGMPLGREPETIEPSRPVLLAESWPAAVHLARLLEAPGFIVASGDFADAARALGLTDVKFEELEVR